MKGVLYGYTNSRGIHVVAGWPRKPTGPRTQKQIDSSDTFANCIQAIKFALPEQVAVAYDGTTGTGYMPRDILLSAMYGTNVSAWLSDGTGIFSRRDVSQTIQPLLDSITSTIGSMLVRTSTGWQALTPGIVGTVLTSNGPTSVPSFQPGEAIDPSKVAQKIAAVVTPVTSGTGATTSTLQTFVLPGKTISDPGSTLDVEMQFFATRLDTASHVFFTLGSTTLATYTEGNASNVMLSIRLHIVVIGTNEVQVTMILTAAASLASTYTRNLTVPDLTTDQTFSVKSYSDVTNNITEDTLVAWAS